MNYLEKNPDWLVIDIGSQIGQYSLFAAKFNRKALAVEPFIDNVYRIHKAAKTASLYKNIVLLQNALSNKRNEVKLLSKHNINVAAQTLLQYKDKVYERDPKNKYLVETILFDDIVPYLPRKDDGTEFTKALLKIDIEGFEPYAFQHASKLFDKLDISVIYMEWGNIPIQTDATDIILQMIEFLTQRKFKPFINESHPLDLNNWRNWPFNVMWLK